MPQLNKLKNSRDQWKEKTAKLVLKNKNLAKAINRANLKNDVLKAELKKLKKN